MPIFALTIDFLSFRIRANMYTYLFLTLVVECNNSYTELFQSMFTCSLFK